MKDPERGSDVETSSRKRGPRVHLHTTIAASTRSLLKELAGESGRINDVLEEAVAYYSRRRGIPDCDDCEMNKISRIRDSLIQSADMALVSSRLMTLLANCSLGLVSTNELIESAERIGIQQTKLLRGLGTIPEEYWSNDFDSFLQYAGVLQRMGVFRSIEPHSEKKSILATMGMLPTVPELLLTVLIASWDEAGFTLDAEVVADNKISIKWVEERQFPIAKETRNNRMVKAWHERLEQIAAQGRSRSAITLSPSLLDWLVSHTIEDPISDRTLVSIRESAGLNADDSSEQQTVHNRIRRTLSVVSTFGLWESSNVSEDGDLVRVQVRCRTPNMKDLSVKLVRSLLMIEGVEEVTREEGVATAILYFGETREVGRKYIR